MSVLFRRARKWSKFATFTTIYYVIKTENHSNAFGKVQMFTLILAYMQQQIKLARSRTGSQIE